MAVKPEISPEKKRRGRPPKNSESDLSAAGEVQRRFRCKSEDDKKYLGLRYEFGKILSSGMIGQVYLARDRNQKLMNFVCIKKMMGSKMAEKNIFASVKREVKILQKIQDIKGCVRLLDIFWDDESLSLVMPYYSRGDLYTHA